MDTMNFRVDNSRVFMTLEKGDYINRTFESFAENKGVELSTISSVMLEGYQGWGAMFYPVDYIQAVKQWAQKNNSLIIFDEIQSGFGRTGKLFAFEHYGIEPDLICCGKGISSSLPLSAVIGAKEIIDVDPSLNSTHGGNPICCAATLANIDVLLSENLVERAILFSGEEKSLEMNHFNLESEHDILDDKTHLDLTPMTIAEVEKQLIFSTLKRTSDNRTQAADILGISVRTLRNKLHQYEESGDSPFLVGEGN